MAIGGKKGGAETEMVVGCKVGNDEKEMWPYFHCTMSKYRHRNFLEKPAKKSSVIFTERYVVNIWINFSTAFSECVYTYT